MKSTFLTATVLSFAASFSAAFADTPSAERVAQLKAEIRAISDENAFNDKATATKTRAQLNVLVEELIKAYPATSAADQLPALEGSWKQLWSDDFDGESDYGNPIQPDKSTVFQYISKDGWFYNIANAKTPLPFAKPLTLLRGEYIVNSNDLTIEFTKVSARLGGLKASESVETVVEGVEAGKVFTIGAPGGGKYPKGPVGARGTLRNIYLDKDFRLSTGENLTFNQGVTNLYVLDRADSLAAK